MAAYSRKPDRDVARRRWMPWLKRAGTSPPIAWAAAQAAHDAERTAREGAGAAEPLPEREPASRSHEVCTFEVV
jgi:hypothetical protein